MRTIRFFFLFLIILACSSCRQEELQIKYQDYVAVVSDGNSKAVGNAVILKKDGNKLYCLTSAHLFKWLEKGYTLTFPGGKIRDIRNIQKDKDLDLAVVEVDGAKLKENTDYKIPVFLRYRSDLDEKTFYIVNDEYYQEPLRRITGHDNSSIHFPGTIEKGRSGSPVFVKGVPVCVGVVSGYYTKESKKGEQIRILLPYEKYCNQDYVFSQTENPSGFWGTVSAFFQKISAFF